MSEPSEAVAASFVWTQPDGSCRVCRSPASATHEPACWFGAAVSYAYQRGVQQGFYDRSIEDRVQEWREAHPHEVTPDGKR